jgi:hypothetical protein
MALAEAQDAPRRPATTREIYDDLAALETEFCRVTIDLNARELAVSTEPICLAGLPLGSFEIVLVWSRLAARSGAYSIAAVDARPSDADADVVHPHVRDGSLCEGDARPAILAALADGRILDFFTIVARTLATYNEHSAFVAVERWHGLSCSDCGASVDDDDASCCERCGQELCDGCVGSCQDCGQTACSECLARCVICSDGCCSGCLQACQRCRRRCCGRCLTDEICTTCVADQGELAPALPRAGDAAATVHALCLGQVGVPA